jgi:hypothetical protein
VKKATDHFPRAALTELKQNMSHNSSHVHGDVEVSRRRAGTLNGSTGSMGSSITDFFITEVFWFITHNPIMAYRFLRYCQSRNFGEATEFLQKVCVYVDE